jgi:signal transduction histidine kinase
MQFPHAFFYAIRYLKTILLLCCIFYSTGTYGQHPDSLLIENIFNQGWKNININRDSAVYYFEKGKKISKDRKIISGLVTYYNYYAALMTAGNNINKAFDYYDKAIAFAAENNLNIDLGLTYMKLGNLHQFTGDYAKAGENYLAAAALLKTNEDRKQIIGLYRNIISTLNNLQLQNQSLQNVLPALQNDNTSEKEIVSILSQKKTNETSLDFPDQTTLREISSGYVYVIFGGAKFPVADLYVLGNYSNYRNIQKIPDGMLSQIPDIPREGTILTQLNNEVVWVIKDRLRHQIDNPEVLQFFGGWDAVCTVPANTLQQVPDGDDTVTMQNVLTTFNFKKEYEGLTDTLKAVLAQNTLLLAEVGKKLKAKNNELQKRKILLWSSLVGIIALLCIGILLLRNSRQKQKLHRQSLQGLKAEQEAQRKMELEKERTRIATDMHDDLGAGLTRIKFIAEDISEKTNDTALQAEMEKLKTSSIELVENMAEIIWAMNEKNNSLEDLLFYLRSYAVEYCHGHKLTCEFFLPENIPQKIIGGQFRRNFFLLLKESLHNIVKHAGAKKVAITITTDNELSLTISDDGKGFEPATQQTGNGLLSMQQRARVLKGKLVVSSQPGTSITLKVPV